MFEEEIWTETDQAAIFYVALRLRSFVAQRLRGGVSALSARCLQPVAARTVGRVCRLHGGKMSYAATASFPASSFVLEAR